MTRIAPMMAMLLAFQAAKPVPAPFFVTDLPLDQMKGTQAIVETATGTFVIDLLPEAAPNHVGHFIKQARAGAYDGTTFHRAVKYGIVQAGDPISKDPAKRDAYGTGGLRVLRAERSSEKETRGAVSAVIIPGDPDSAGAQFFICVTDQPGLDGQYTVFGRVVEGMEVVERISEAAVDAGGKVIDRLEIRRVTIRDRPPEPFAADTAAGLAAYHAVLETSMGAIEIEFFPEKALEHVRNFLRLADRGVFDGTAFHRVVQGFVIQTGGLTSRATPLTQAQQAFVHPLAPEFNDAPHVKGIVSMARGDDPASATTSFFICTGTAPTLDGKYTVFGRVTSGLEVVDAIEHAPLNGEAPVTRIELTRVRLERKP